MGIIAGSPSHHKSFIQPSIQQLIPQPQSLNLIKTQLCLQTQQIYQMYRYFNRLDHKSKGYLQIDDLIFNFSQYDQNFAQLPYLEALFTLIKKQKDNLVFFHEFIIGITVFCLMNTESVLQFVFDCIDKDDDNKISKNDIKTFLQYQNPINNQHTFFTNFLPKIDKLKLKQNQTLLDFQQFRSNSDKLYFLIWPAYQLQQTFRNQTLGQNAWYQLYSKAQKRQYEIKNNEKKESRLKQKLQILKTLTKKEQGPFFKDQLKNRKPYEINTDLNIEIHQTRPKRNSCPYLKPNLLIDQALMNLQNK